MSYLDNPKIVTMLAKMNNTATGQKRRAKMVEEFERHDRWIAERSAALDAEKTALTIRSAAQDIEIATLENTGAALQARLDRDQARTKGRGQPTLRVVK